MSPTGKIKITALRHEKKNILLCKFMPSRSGLENESYLLGLHNIKDFALLDPAVSCAFTFSTRLFASSIPDAEAIGQITATAPAFACFSVYTWNFDRTAAICRKLKSDAPHIVIIAGGPGISEDIADRLDFCDIAVAGEGEIPFREVLRGFCGENPEPTLIAQKPFSMPPCDNIDDIPSFWTTRHAAQLTGEIIYESARGCGHPCRFCALSTREKRSYSTVRIIDDIRSLLSLIAPDENTNIVFIEPRLNSNRERLEEILETIAAANIRRIPFAAYFGAENIDEELMRLLGRAGFTSVRLELISTNMAALKQLRIPRPDLAHIESAAKTVGGPILSQDIIYGLPGDTYDGFRETMRWLSRNNLLNINATHFKILPGTDLWHAAAGERIVFEHSYPHRVIECPGFSGEEIAAAERLAMNYKAITRLMTPAFHAYLREETGFGLVDMCERIGNEIPGWDKAYTTRAPGEAEVRILPALAGCVSDWFSANIVDRTVLKVACEFIEAAARKRFP